MKIPLLFLTITLQVVAFQLLWTRLHRRLPDLLIGNRELPADIASAIGEFRSRAGRGRIVLGILYLLSALLIAFVLPLDIHQQKLALAAVSLLSSATLLTGFFLDIAKLRRLSSSLPDPPTRVAGLKPRSLSMAYPVILEAIPIAVALGTVGATVWALHQGATISAFRAWFRPAVQVFYLGLTLSLASFQVRTGSCLTWKARSFQTSPEEAVALTEKLIRMEVRYLFICRIGMALLLGIMQARILRAALGLAPWTFLPPAEWAVLALLLGQFIVYLLRHPIRAVKSSLPLHEGHPRNGGTS